MRNHWFLAIIILLLCQATRTESDFLYSRQLMMGSIAFPPVLSCAPALRMYYAGDIIQTTPSRADAQLSFSLFTPINQTTFYLLISESDALSAHMVPSQANDTSNTVDYLRLRAHSYYLLYMLEYNPKQTKWSWQQVYLSGDQIPLDAIILIFDPHLVEGLSGGGSSQLPTITMKTNLLAQLKKKGQSLKQYVNQLLIGCLDCDTIHKTRTKPVTRICQNSKHVLELPSVT